MKIKFLALVAAMMISTTSFAQFSQSKSSSNSSNEISKGWNSLYVQYNSIGTSYSLSSFNDRDYDYGDIYQKAIDNSGLSEKLNAFSIGLQPCHQFDTIYTSLFGGWCSSPVRILFR